MTMTRDDLLVLARRILSPDGPTGAERRQLIARLQAEARDPGLIERLLSGDLHLTPAGLVGLVLASQSARFRLPSVN
jgi:hypothetical protein